jgi:hypothetical protein
MPRKRPADAVPRAAWSSTLDEKPKLGRQTIPDNILLGARDAWAFLLEQSWPEIGWPLLCIRDRRKSTIEDIQKIFEPVKLKPHNPGLAAHLYCESSEIANAAEVRRNRIRYGDLNVEIYQLQPKRDDQERACREVESALQMADPGDRETIQEEGSRRRKRLLELDADLKKLKDEFDALSKKLRDQEAYVSRVELLDFLQSRRYAVTPRNLANALVGLPTMKWRQSFVRCASMPFGSDPSYEYQIVETISEIWNRRPVDFKEAPLEYFRAKFLALPKTLGYTRRVIWENWSDMKRALQECWKEDTNPGSFPFVLSAAFLPLATRQKNPAERILAERDKLGVTSQNQ